MRTVCLAALLLLLCAGSAGAQSLHGRVVDRATGAPVAGARLTLLDSAGGTAASVASDAGGAFRLEAAAPGRYRVSAAGEGYRVALTRELELGAGVSVEAELRMDPAPLAPAAVRGLAERGRGVHGRILDDSTRLPVAGATVSLVAERGRGGARVRTGRDGTFTVVPDRAGRFRLEASAEGYQPSTTAPLTLTPGDTVQLELSVSRRSMRLAPITVVASSRDLLRDRNLAEFEWRRRAGVRGRFVGPEEIRRINPFYATDVLQHVPFVQVTGGHRRTVTLRTPFGGRCVPSVFVDGHESGADASTTIDEVVSGATIAAVEVYERASEAPPEYMPIGRRADCGVVVVWTLPARVDG
jgi:hypothetical protein